MDYLVALREDHLRNQLECRYSASSRTSSNSVNPSIARWIQEDSHCLGYRSSWFGDYVKEETLL